MRVLAWVAISVDRRIDCRGLDADRLLAVLGEDRAELLRDIGVDGRGRGYDGLHGFAASSIAFGSHVLLSSIQGLVTTVPALTGAVLRALFWAASGAL